MAAAPAAGSVTPAHLGFLAIFNPELGNTDDTIDDQIVYYASVTAQANRKRRRRTRASRPTEGISQGERHERLRQIGLAQGMAGFSRGFAEGAAVDAIDTEKSRVVLHELEPGWWILAVRLTSDIARRGWPWLTLVARASISQRFRYHHGFRLRLGTSRRSDSNTRAER